MGFDESRLDNFAARSSSKWRRFDSDVLPMHVAEMDFEVAKEIRDLIIDFTNRSDLGYLGPVPEVAEAFEKYALKTWGWQIDKASLKLATDVGVAAVEIMRLLCKPGDKVVINSPVYSSFYHWIHEVSAIEHDVPLVRTGDTWELDLVGLEEAFKQGSKVFMMCSPQNPVGKVFTEAELVAIADLANKYQVVVISDEIHAPLSFVPFTPYLKVAGAAENGVTITSSSKAWNTAGLKAAFLITQSERMRQKLAKLPDAMHWRSSLLGGFAMAKAFSECSYWIDQTNARIQENYALLQKLLGEHLPKAKLTKLNATYLAWIDLAGYELDHPQQHILRVGKVSLVPGEDHAPADQYSNFVRLNIATSQERISEAVRRMALALQG